MKEVKIQPHVLETLRRFGGKPRRVEDVMKESGLTREIVLNHIRSGRAAGIAVEHIGPMNHRYFYVPSSLLINAKETVTAQVLAIFKANPGEEFTVQEFCDLLNADKSHIHSVLSVNRLRNKDKLNILSRTDSTGAHRKVYWYEPEQQKLDLGET